VQPASWRGEREREREREREAGSPQTTSHRRVKALANSFPSAPSTLYTQHLWALLEANNSQQTVVGQRDKIKAPKFDIVLSGLNSGQSIFAQILGLNKYMHCLIFEPNILAAQFRNRISLTIAFNVSTFVMKKLGE
jgi:hypothetical protein